MNSYEEVTNVKIPDTVKEAANKEIYTQAEVVENSDVSADKVSKLVDDVKSNRQRKNVTDHHTIVNIINNYTSTTTSTSQTTILKTLQSPLNKLKTFRETLTITKPKYQTFSILQAVLMLPK